MKRLVLLRPEPGAGASAARARAAGLDVVVMPLFAVRPVPWQVPGGSYDALVITSANAIRHGGEALDGVRVLPVVSVGGASAAAARAAGFTVAHEGCGGVNDLLPALPGDWRLLHLAGRDRTTLETPQRIDVVTVYEAVALPSPSAVEQLRGAVAAVHSARAAARLADLTEQAGIDRSSIVLAALSPAVAKAAGTGWQEVAIAPAPTDAALLALAAELCL